MSLITYWVWIALIAIPLLVFSATPESSRQWRMWRSAIAFFIGYCLTMAVFLLDFCCFKELNARWAVHWIVLGPLWTFTYIGWLELSWRIYYRHELKGLIKGLGDDWINGKILFICLIGTLLIIAFFSLIFFMIIQHYKKGIL